MTGTPPISFAHRCLIASATQQKAHPLRALTSQKPNPSPLGLSSEVSMTSEDTTDTTSITTATRGAGGAKSL
ncbi:hypothetical protein N7491_010255 [Penicillium cf. griseofulvum]|uniref:Uncharacterized protein n=1 Tax=Penicillium cf. griseofulvum TaxID=2972120 RepID=A0A9W9MZI3_9EURO|nr:hypothetical protein N7472_000588 [Penicillium cf. griseofulvum]KAJ5421810.1 hypothetical protein N7491_010255 [Penicillium cf. griseofulvum]KAJ5428001.1 hypothetical protein N7445_009455 [Penicillium cf. griseofulvum]